MSHGEYHAYLVVRECNRVIHERIRYLEELLKEYIEEEMNRGWFRKPTREQAIKNLESDGMNSYSFTKWRLEHPCRAHVLKTLALTSISGKITLDARDAYYLFGDEHASKND